MTQKIRNNSSSAALWNVCRVVCYHKVLWKSRCVSLPGAQISVWDSCSSRFGRSRHDVIENIYGHGVLTMRWYHRAEFEGLQTGLFWNVSEFQYWYETAYSYCNSQKCQHYAIRAENLHTIFIYSKVCFNQWPRKRVYKDIWCIFLKKPKFEGWKACAWPLLVVVQTLCHCISCICTKQVNQLSQADVTDPNHSVVFTVPCMKLK